MIEEIKAWLFLKYGVQIPTRGIWMILILLISLLLLLIFSFAGSSKKPVMPDSSKLESAGPNAPPRLKTK